MTTDKSSIKLLEQGMKRKTSSCASSSSGTKANLRRSDREVSRARILSEAQIERIRTYICERSNSPESDELKFLLSVYAGLRASEIAGLTMDAVEDAEGQLANTITVNRTIGKGGRSRIVPMHPVIKGALKRLRARHPDVRFLCFSYRRGKMKPQSANAVTCWFAHLYGGAGLKGCSSHSGRRTFITNLARMANLHGKSLRDVQQLAGHANLDTTSAYIDASDDLAGLVGALGTPGEPPVPSGQQKGDTA